MTDPGQPAAKKRTAERDRLVDAALAHVPFDGWTRVALVAGAEDAGLAEFGRGASAVDRLFPLGPRDAVAHFLDLADRRMVEAFASRGLGNLKVRERVAAAVRIRLEQAEPHREAVRKTLAFLALPGNATLGAQALYRTVDEIWHACGDTATDFNFYSKRALLAGVYSTTVLFWLDDESTDRAETWAFLDRRIADVMRIPKLSARVRETVERVKGPLSRLVSTRRRRRRRTA